MRATRARQGNGRVGTACSGHAREIYLNTLPTAQRTLQMPGFPPNELIPKNLVRPPKKGLRVFRPPEETEGIRQGCKEAELLMEGGGEHILGGTQERLQRQVGSLEHTVDGDEGRFGHDRNESR